MEAAAVGSSISHHGGIPTMSRDPPKSLSPSTKSSQPKKLKVDPPTPPPFLLSSSPVEPEQQEPFILNSIQPDRRHSLPASRKSNRASPYRASHHVVRRGKASGKHGKAGAKNQTGLGFGGHKITPEHYKQQFPGALPLGSEVFCWYPSKEVWFSSTVIYARPKSGRSDVPIVGHQGKAGGKLPIADGDCSKPGRLGKGTLSQVIGNSIKQSPAALNRHQGPKPNDYSWGSPIADYDYYIHFHGEDRRNDLWVDVSSLRPEDFEFEASDLCTKRPPGPDEIHKHMDADYLREHEENTKLKTIGKVKIGKYLVETWYFSAYPKEFQNLNILYICEYCLNFFQYENELQFHSNLCSIRYPPGDEIYRDKEKDISVFEVDGSIARQYTENLCFLSKLFLDHKTLKHPVYLFLFYILTERTDEGYRLVGYFSKEKYSHNNLSCIMCLPQHQRKGYGQFLINLSYALSKREGKKGTPERPLSDLGKATYVKYWGQTAIAALLLPEFQDKEMISIEQLAETTSIEPADIMMALDELGILQYRQNTPFIFLPTEYLQEAAQWCRVAFVNQILPTIHNLPASEFGLPEELVLDPDDCCAVPEAPRKEAGRREQRRSKRKSRATSGVDYEWDSEITRKRLKSQQHVLEKTAGELELAPGNPISKATTSSTVAPINLQDLRWESYDLHLGLYEYAPTAT